MACLACVNQSPVVWQHHDLHASTMSCTAVAGVGFACSCSDTAVGVCWPVLLAAALQAWLEAAWQAGFDPGGAALLGPSVQCTRKWIGTTEAAAMLRYFGCRALIVDFYGECFYSDLPFGSISDLRDIREWLA